MCGRYATGAVTWAQFRDWLGLIAPAPEAPELAPRWNVAPTTLAPIIRPGGVGGLARWGLIPVWARGRMKDQRFNTINARVETAAEKPSYRAALGNRCLVPAIGYYEWCGAGQARRPWFITAERNAPAICFAGLWTEARLDDFAGVTFTILTQAAAGPIAKIHDRMPVILDETGHADWLEGAGAVTDARTIDPGRLQLHAVGPEIGQVRREGPGLIAPVPGPAPGLF